MKSYGWIGWTWLLSVCVLVVLMLPLFGCLSAAHRVDHDVFIGAGGSHDGNGRTTTLSASQPSPHFPDMSAPIIQREPAVGDVAVVVVRGVRYEVIRKTDGKLYVLREVK
jgi:hypothetical protein